MTTHLECVKLGIIRIKLFFKAGHQANGKKRYCTKISQIERHVSTQCSYPSAVSVFLQDNCPPASAAQKLQKRVNNESIVLLKANFFMSHCLCNVLQQAIAKEMLGIYIRQVSIVPCSLKCTNPVYSSY